MNKHCTIDMETLARNPKALVLSAAATIFDVNGVYEKLSAFFFMEEQIKVYQREIEAETLAWWQMQPGATRLFARCASRAETILLADFALNFRDKVLQHAGEDVRIWSNGSSFDTVILDSIFTQVGLPRPWNFWNERCYRTVKAMHQIEKGKTRPGEKHDAVLDDDFQFSCLQDFLRQNPHLDR